MSLSGSHQRITLQSPEKNEPGGKSFIFTIQNKNETLSEKNPNMKAGEYIAENKKMATIWWIVIVLGAVLIIIAIISAIAAASAVNTAANTL